MRLLRQFLRVVLLVCVLCLWVLAAPALGGGDAPCLNDQDPSWLHLQDLPGPELAASRAHLSPAVFSGVLKSVLVQRDGTVRAWFSVDRVLKMPGGRCNDSDHAKCRDDPDHPLPLGGGRRSARARAAGRYTRVSYSRNKYIGDFVSLPAVRPRDPGDLYASTYTRLLLRAANRTGRLLPQAAFRREARTAAAAAGRPEDMEVVFHGPGGGRCVLEVDQDSLRLGRPYAVFGVPVRRHAWPSLSACALPVPADNRTLRAVRKVLCEGCAKPAGVSGLRKAKAEEGSRARFHCHLSGNPLPWVDWYKDGRRIVSKGRVRVKTKKRTSRLVIRRVRLQDRGVYECRAGNVVARESASASATLAVRKRRKKAATPVLPPPATTSSTFASVTTQSSPWTTEPCERSDFCNNGGTCIFYKDVQELVCHCAEGFVGLRCEYKNVRVSLSRQSTNSNSRGSIP